MTVERRSSLSRLVSSSLCVAQSESQQQQQHCIYRRKKLNFDGKIKHCACVNINSMAFFSPLYFFLSSSMLNLWKIKNWKIFKIVATILASSFRRRCTFILLDRRVFCCMIKLSDFRTYITPVYLICREYEFLGSFIVLSAMHKKKSQEKYGNLIFQQRENNISLPNFFFVECSLRTRHSPVN